MKNREKWIQILGEDYFSPSVYRDEPILRTAATMKNYMPQQYREMRRLALQNGAFSRSTEEIFYRQAKFMEHFDDEYEYGGEFFRYYPTYQSMSDLQLRGYFSWRTKVRRGNVQKTSLSFVFIYLYELLNGIGYDTPQAGYACLKSFCETYCAIDARLHRYAMLWLRDYVIYYGLDEALLRDYFDIPAEQALTVMQSYRDAEDQDLFQAVCACSSYSIDHSRFYRTCPDDVRAVVCRVYRAYADYYEKNRKTGLFEAVFGTSFDTPYNMFSSAIFWPREKHADTRIVIGPFTSFACKDGKWTYTKLWSGTDRKRQIGLLLRSIDALMRIDADFPHTLKCTDTPKYLQKIIKDCISQHKEAKKRTAARTVRIDLSKLQGIREAAEITRDKLIVEEDTDTSNVQASEPEPIADTIRPFGLDETEYAVLHALLYGEAAKEPVRERGLSVTVVADSINEKCFDAFADTVLDFDGDKPYVLEDYVDELKGLIQ